MTPNLAYKPTNADLSVLEHVLGWQSERADLLYAKFAIGAPDSTWRLDVPGRQILFDHPQAGASVASITIAGTHDPDSNTFMWWWANPSRDTLSHPESRAMSTPSGVETPEAAVLDRLGAQPVIEANEGVAFALAGALALKLDAAGAYRTKAGTVWVYWVLHTVAGTTMSDGAEPAGSPLPLDH